MKQLRRKHTSRYISRRTAGFLLAVAAVLLPCAAHTAFAKAVGPVPLGEALFADTEASTNVPLSACGGDPHIFGFSLEFTGSASNAFQIAVLYFCLAVIAAIAVACALFGLKRVGEILRATLSPAGLAAFLGVSGVVVVIAQKRGGDEAARAPLPRTAERQIGSVSPLPGSVTNEKWRAHGAYQNWIHIPATNWWARSPSGGWLDRMTAFAWCEFRPDLFTTNAWPRPFPERLSLAPESHWPLLASGESLFCHAATPSNTLVMTWLGGLYGRSHTNQVDFQAELFNDGSVDYRYADRTERHVATLPFDFDGDGLENSVDPDPLTAGSDAHGTNAEWYNTVCHNVFEAAEGGPGAVPAMADTEVGPPGIALSPRTPDVNSNAYYFVDVVSERGPAPIYFTGDRDSRLGNPVVVALAGATNRVPLLIGVDYSVTSDTPFSVSFPIDYIHPTVTTNGVADYNVRWPLNFLFTESIGDSSRAYTVTVEPYDPGGVLEWNVSAPMRGGVRGVCDCVYCYGNLALFTCSSACTCSGGCRARGRYLFEAAEFALEGGECRCGFDDPSGDATPCPHSPNDGPSLNITFSKSAVIFESAYEDSPGVMKPRRSTRVRLTIDVYGGPHGGTFLLSDQKISKLAKVSGDVMLPYGQRLAAYESFHATGVFEGVAPSDSENDVKVIGSFIESDTDAAFGDASQLSVVRVKLKPIVEAPKNKCQYRHSYGVCELVKHVQEPSSPVVTWNPVGGGSNELYAGSAHYRCPLDGCENPLRAEIGYVHYTPQIDVLEPLGVESAARRPLIYSNVVHKGESGGVGMELYLYIMPLEVSFSEIYVEEVPCFTYEANGYFTNPYFNGAFAHTGGQWGAGAGTWLEVDVKGNKVDGYDTAAYKDKIPWLTPSGAPTTNVAYAWKDGSVDIDNPFGWHVKGTRGNTPPHKVFGEHIQDTIMLDRQGRVGVWKLDNWVERSTNDVVWLYGPRAQEEE